MKRFVYVGQRAADSRRGGIGIVEADCTTGRLRKVRDVELGNATYMAFSADGSRLYSTHDDPAFGPKGKNGGIVSFRVEGDSLAKLNAVPTRFGSPCHVSVAPDGRSVVWAEYSDATCGFAPILADGSLGAPSVPVQHFGSGPDKSRQEKAHAHCARVSPDGKFLAVCDLGMDEVKVYDYANRANGLKELAANTVKTLPAGGGPRHVVFHPNGRLAFVVFELMNLAASYRFENGVFRHVQTAPLLPGSFTAFSKASAIVLSADGRTLFCTNRGHDSLAVIAVDPESGSLSLQKVIPFGGKWPWDMDFLPGENVLAVAFEKEGRVATYSWDRSRLALSPMDSVSGYGPTFCLKVGTAG